MSATQAWLCVFAVAVPLNFAWEMAQAPLYRPMGTFWQGTWRCFSASIGDGVMVLAIVAVGSVVFRSALWFVHTGMSRTFFGVAAGVVLATAVELWALATGRWSYRPVMPLLPGTEIAIVPLAQMGILVPATLRLARAWLVRTV